MAGTGTLSQASCTSSNFRTSLATCRAASGVGLALSAGWRSNAALWWRGNAAGRGGFDVTFRFALSTFVLGFRGFVGLRATAAAIGNVEPSTLLDVIGMRFDTIATAWSLVTSDAVGPQTVTTALGNVVANDVLELKLWCEPNSSTVNYRVRNLTAGTTVASGTISSNLPSSTTFLSKHIWCDTGLIAATAAQVEYHDSFVDTEAPAIAA